VKKFKKTKPITTVEQFACLCYCNNDCYKRCLAAGGSDFDFLKQSQTWETYNCEYGGQYQPYGMTD